jgi:3-oxoacyl-[acyl-carrier-protein] synthase III
MAATTVETTTRTRARRSTAPQPTARARRRRLLRAGLFGVGAALPEGVVTNADLERRLDTDDAWIVRRTGIRERRLLPDGAPLAPLAADACRLALQDAGIDAADVDHIIVSTITPDRVTPGLGPEVAGIIGADQASALDLNAACAGFLYGLDHAAALVESGRARVVLVCGAEALSRITDHDDRSTAVLFGDGAGAAVVCAGDGLEVGIGTFELGLDAARADLLYAERDEQRLRMEGREVYRHAVRRMAEATSTALARAGLTVADVDLFVAHQANVRILYAAADELGVPRERVAVNVDLTANTSSASIPLALARAEHEGRLRPGATVAMAAFGAGFVWGAGIVGWKECVHPCA